MQKRRLGRTGIDVSPIGLGTVKFGRQQGVKYPHAFELPTDQEIENLLACANDYGINLIDTAPAYGVSEERLGKALHGQRQRWVITTKVGETFEDGKSHFDFSASVIRQSIERSLLRLRTDYLDVVLVHSSGEDERIIEEEHVFSQLAALKKEGKIRSFGMSTKTIVGGLLTVDMADVVMVTHNPAYTEERDVIAYAHQQQKGVFIKKALASGHLQTLGGDDPVQHAMRFVLEEPGVSSVIVGTINPLHLKGCCEAIESSLCFSDKN